MLERSPMQVHASGVALVDVREDHEWESVHAPGALHIPLGQLIERLGELPDEPLAVVCHSGSRSGRAVEYLTSIGLGAVNVAGGMVRWQADGLPVERGA